MRKLISIVAFLLLIGCGSKNFFSGNDKTKASDAQEALDQLDRGDANAAYESIVKTLSAEQVAALDAAKADSSESRTNLIEAFKDPTETERNITYPILSKTLLEKPGVGVNLINFSVELSKLTSGSSLALACVVDPNFKRLINAVSSVTNINQVFTAEIIAKLGVYSLTIQQNTDGSAVIGYSKHGEVPQSVVLNSGFATIIGFASVVKFADTDGDGQVSATEAAVFFHTNPVEKGIAYATSVYDFLAAAVQTLTLFADQQKAAGNEIKGISTAINRMSSYRDGLFGFKLVTGGVAEKTSSCANSTTTDGAIRVKCVEQWLVDVMKCK